MTNVLKFLALVFGFALWAYLGYVGKTDLNAMIDLLKLGLGGLIYHMLNGDGTMTIPGLGKADTPAPGVPMHWTGPGAPPASQSGFTSIRTLLVIAFVALVVGVLLAGCAAVPQPVVDAKKVSDDNVVTNLKLGMCNLPIGTVLRHPEIQQFVIESCRP